MAIRDDDASSDAVVPDEFIPARLPADLGASIAAQYVQQLGVSQPIGQQASGASFGGQQLAPVYAAPHQLGGLVYNGQLQLKVRRAGGGSRSLAESRVFRSL